MSEINSSNPLLHEELFNSVKYFFNQIILWAEAHPAISNLLSVLIGTVMSALLDVRGRIRNLFNNNGGTNIGVNGDLNVEGDLNINPSYQPDTLVNNFSLGEKEKHICEQIAKLTETQSQKMDLRPHFDKFLNEIKMQEFEVAGGILLQILNSVIKSIDTFARQNELGSEIDNLITSANKLDGALENNPKKELIKKEIENCRGLLWIFVCRLPL